MLVLRSPHCAGHGMSSLHACACLYHKGTSHIVIWNGSVQPCNKVHKGHVRRMSCRWIADK